MGAAPRAVFRRQRATASDGDTPDGLLHGSHPGDRYIRVVRHQPGTAPPMGAVSVTAREPMPRTGLARGLRVVKQIVIGQPLATAQASHERLTKPKALAVLSSDALS